MRRVRSGNPQAENEAAEQRHEPSTVRMTILIGLAAFVLVSALIIHSSLWGWFLSIGGRASPAMNATWNVVASRVPSPAESFAALQLNPQADLRDFVLKSERRLRSYGWIDAEAGIIQLPIRRAMELIARKGLPHWETGVTKVSFTGSPTTSSNSVHDAFLKEMAQASLGAYELGRLAAAKAQSNSLSDLGRKIARERQKLLEDIQDSAKSAGVDLPRSPGLQDQLAYQELSQKEGKDFDTEMVKQLLGDNAASLKEAEEVVRKAQPHSREFALASHLKEKLETELADVRDAAQSAGLSQGTVLAIIQRRQKAASVPNALEAQPTVQPEESHESQTGNNSSTNSQTQVESGKSEKTSGDEQAGSKQPEKSNSDSSAGAASEPTGKSGGSQQGQGEPDRNQPDHPHANSAQNSGQPFELTVDAALLNRLAHAAAAEHEFGRIGAARSQNEKLADTSLKIQRDHSWLRSKLQNLGKELDLDLPTEPGLPEELALKHLQKQQGSDFDTLLARQMLADEVRLIQETENATNYLRQSQVKDLANQVLERLHDDLDQTKKAARAVGLSSKEIEQTIATQLMAAGVPYQLTTGVLMSSTRPGKQNEQEQSKAREEESASSGEQQKNSKSHQAQGSSEEGGGQQTGSKSSAGSEKTNPHSNKPNEKQSQGQAESNSSRGSQPSASGSSSASSKESGNQSNTNKEARVALDLNSAFLQTVAEASLDETQLGDLGARRASNKQLKDFSRKLRQQAQERQEQIQNLARQRHASLPHSPTLVQQLGLDRPPQAFDRALARQILEHQAALLAKLHRVQDQLEDPQIRKQAKDLAREVKQQLDKARDIAAAVGLQKNEIQSAVQHQWEALGASDLISAEGSSQGKGSSESQQQQSNHSESATGTGQESGSNHSTAGKTQNSGNQHHEDQ